MLLNFLLLSLVFYSCSGREKHYLVVGGFSDSSTLAKSEIVTSQSAVDCAIPDFPKVIMGPVSMKYRGDPAVCAGWEGWGVQDDADYNGDCYIYSPKRNVWTKAAFSISPRANGCAVYMPEIDKWLIFGGIDVKNNFAAKQEVEIFDPKTGEVAKGPVLPEQIEGYVAAVMITPQHLLISYGVSKNSYILDVTNFREAITSDVLTRNLEHSVPRKPVMGTFKNDSSGQMAIAFIGENGVEVLNQDLNLWTVHSPADSSPKTGMTAVQDGFGSFLTFGGYDVTGNRRFGNVYRFTGRGMEMEGSSVLGEAKSNFAVVELDSLPEHCTK